MNLPDDVTYHPRQPELIAKNNPAVIRIEETPRHPNNARYLIRPYRFDAAIAPYLHGDWENFNCDFGFNHDREKVIYSRASHGSEEFPADTQLPDILVVPNLHAEIKDQEVWSFGCTMGHYYPYERERGYRIAEVFEVQSFGLVVLDCEDGNVEIRVAQEGDKVAVPTGCHATLYNLGDHDLPLIALSFYGRPPQPANQFLVSHHGPILLSYYDQQEVIFKLNRRYLNNPDHDAGVRLKVAPRKDEDRTIRVARGARLDMGRMLYEQLTQNPEIIGRFARLGISVKPASPEAVLEPLTEKLKVDRGSRLFFALPLVNATRKGTDVYRYFIPETEAAKPDPPKPQLPDHDETEKRTTTEAETPTDAQPLNRPLVIVVEGIGDWVEKAYRPLFVKKAKEKRRLSVFYTNDSRWKETPTWATKKVGSDEADLNAENDGLRSWETYLDKANPEDFAKYPRLRPDAVFIVTPDFTHSLLARQWLNKAPLVLVEKPFDSQVSNVHDLRRSYRYPTHTEVLGLDHFQFYALPIDDLQTKIRKHLGGAIKRIDFFMTESRPIEAGREKSLQYGLMLDMLPHLLALLTYFGDVGTIDDISVVEAGRYQPLITATEDYPKEGSIKDEIADQFDSETYSRVHLTFQDHSRNGFHIPCLAVVGKGFDSEVKYLEITGISGHAIRVDLRSQPKDDSSGYPWDSIFFLQGDSTLNDPNITLREINDPNQLGRTLNIVEDARDPARFCRRLKRQRYEELLNDLLDGTTTAVRSTLTLTQGQSIVRALDRIWWAIRAEKSEWKDFPLLQQSPFQPVAEAHSTSSSLRKRPNSKTDGPERLIRPTRTLGTISVYDEGEGEDRPLEPVLTRGPANRTPKSQAPCQQLSTDDLVGLLKELREQVRKLPLSLLAHGWKSKEAFEFLTMVLRKLRRDDVLWLVSPDHSSNTLTDGEEKILNHYCSIEINLGKDTDGRLYRNLIADLAFFPALTEKEVKLISELDDRARAVIIDERGPYSEELQRAARATGLHIYCWGGTPRPSVGSNDETGKQPSQSPKTTDDLDQLGKWLAQTARQIENQASRRAELRSRILQMMDTDPSRPNWGRDLAKQADQHQWPNWAVECLPSLYILLDSPSEQIRRVLVWGELLEWLPDVFRDKVEIKEEFCRGELLEVEIPAETETWLSGFARILESNRRELPLINEYSFKVIIHETMLEVEGLLRLLERRLPNALTAFREKRERYFRQMLQSRG